MTEKEKSSVPISRRAAACFLRLTPHALRFTSYRFAVTARRNPRPAGGGDSGSIGGDARTDLFDNDLSDLPGKTFGDFHILQNMAGFGDGI